VIFENKRKVHEATGMLSLDLDRQRRKHIPLRTRNFVKETESREGYVLLRKFWEVEKTNLMITGFFLENESHALGHMVLIFSQSGEKGTCVHAVGF
jgi:hypothetical protein